MSYIEDKIEDAYDDIKELVIENMKFINTPEDVYGDEQEMELDDILDLETPDRYSDDIRTKFDILISVIDNFSQHSNKFELKFSPQAKAKYENIKAEIIELRKDDWIGNSHGNVVNLGKLFKYLEENYDLDELYFEGDSNYIRDEKGNVIYEMPLPEPDEEKQYNR